jgi:cobalt-zinc-cadmium efflux system outer membrane protein
LIELAVAGRPDLRAQTAQVERAQSAIALAKRQRWGDPALTVSYNQQGTGQEALQPPTLTVGLALPVAILYQQQGEIAKAEAELRAQQVTLDKSRAQIANEVRAAWSAFSSARAQMERMDGRSSPGPTAPAI